MNEPDEDTNSGRPPRTSEGNTLPALSQRDLTMDATVRFTAGGSPIPALSQRDLTMDATVRFTTGGSPVQQQSMQVAKMPGAGTIVFSRYRLLHVLGRGGMGIVWLAEDTKLSRTVALKFLPDIIGIDPVAVAELKDETKRGLDLAHPNIVRIYDFVDDADAAAISMEFVNGKTLAELRINKPEKVFSVTELSPLVRQVCDALDYAHVQAKIVHRDLKPANLMVDSESRLKITDFGIACSINETMTRVSFSQGGGGTTSGTMLYMSPQQAMGDRPAPTDDIYSLGATIYELLTGKPPFYRGDIASQVTSKTAPPIKQRREELRIAAQDDIPADWEQVIAACLDKDPAFRPQSAMELSLRLGLTSKSDARPLIVMVRPDGTSEGEPGAARVKAGPRPWWLQKRWITTAATVVGLPLLAWWWTHRPGEWSVQTYPQGALVVIGNDRRVAPAVFESLPPGKHKADITLDGFEPRSLEFNVNAGQKVNIGVIKLSSVTGNIPLSPDGDDFEITAVNTNVVPPQPKVGEPPKGYWNLDEIFIHSEYANFSENGRRFLLHEVQKALRARGQFKGELGSDSDVELHKSIQNFQALRELKTTGLFDSATITALEMLNLPDKADWNIASEQKESEGWWARNVGGPLKRMFGKSEE